MDLGQKNKSLFISVIVLAILNIISLSSFWFLYFNNPMDPFPHHGKHDFRHVKNYFREELNLTDVQAAKFQNEQDAFFKKSHELMKNLNVEKQKLFDELFKNQNDSDVISQLQSNINKYQAELDKAAFEHFGRLKSLCNTEQQQKFRNLLREMASMMDSNLDGRPGMPPPPPMMKPPGEN
jgi:periplasmic protein CpxP/Spy